MSVSNLVRSEVRSEVRSNSASKLRSKPAVKSATKILFNHWWKDKQVGDTLGVTAKWQLPNLVTNEVTKNRPLTGTQNVSTQGSTQQKISVNSTVNTKTAFIGQYVSFDTLR